MRVDLAAQVGDTIHVPCTDIFISGTIMQVMSASVSHALYLTGGERASETAKFIQMVDKFFDCLNVTSYNEGKLKRKPFIQPYRCNKDFRLNVC